MVTYLTFNLIAPEPILHSCTLSGDHRISASQTSSFLSSINYSFLHMLNQTTPLFWLFALFNFRPLRLFQLT